jgi:hypothetical protein
MVDRKLFARIKTADAGRKEILFRTVLKIGSSLIREQRFWHSVRL